MWFRRRRPSAPAPVLPAPAANPIEPVSHVEMRRRDVAVKALLERISELEARVDELTAARPDMVFIEGATLEDVLDVRMHSAKVAAELSRLEINMAARNDALRADVRSATNAAAEPAEVVALTPDDTGWSTRLTG